MIIGINIKDGNELDIIYQTNRYRISTNSNDELQLTRVAKSEITKPEEKKFTNTISASVAATRLGFSNADIIRREFLTKEEFDSWIDWRVLNTKMTKEQGKLRKSKFKENGSLSHVPHILDLSSNLKTFFLVDGDAFEKFRQENDITSYEVPSTGKMAKHHPEKRIRVSPKSGNATNSTSKRFQKEWQSSFDLL